MDKNFQQILDGTLATVVGGIILSFWPPFRNFFLNYIRAIQHISSKIMSKLLIVSGLKVNSFYRKLFPYTFPHNYRKDEFFNVVWHWDYDKRFTPIKIKALCPYCTSEIKPKTNGYNVSTFFKCENCGFDSGTIKINPLDLKQTIINKIINGIRGGKNNG